MSDERRAAEAVDPEAENEIEEAEIDETDADEIGGAADDGQDEDAGGDDDEGEEEGARQPVGQQRRPGRRERATQELRLLREQNQRVERELAAIRTQQNQTRVDPAAAARAEAEEWERIRLLPPDEMVQAVQRRSEQRVAFALQQQSVQIHDRIDKAGFDAAARSDPLRAKFARQVEDVLAAERAAGRNPERETIFTYLYGQSALAARGRTTPQRRAARARVDGQRTRPAGGRSDVSRNRQQSGDDEATALAWLTG